MPSLALFEPDIPQNAGAMLRTAACLGVAVSLIEPAGFVLDDRRMARAGMDYLSLAALTRYRSWAAFQAERPPGRLVLLTTRASTTPWRFAFEDTDCLLLGRESAGVPAHVHAAADARLRIPMAPGARSLNVAQAGAIVLAEALRQVDALPGEPP